jgi:adenine phosphoribosyltransferase
MSRDFGWLKNHIAEVADFPRPGIDFKDITPLFADPDAFRFVVDALADHVAGDRVDYVVAVEARGFVTAAPVAYRLGAGLVLVRKAGKLPRRVEATMYALEYGEDYLEVHADAIPSGARVLIVDDVLATGGTAAAAVELVERLGAVVVGLGFIAELAFLHGRDRLAGRDVTTLVTYD